MKRVIIYDPGVVDVVHDNSVGDAQLRAMELAIMRAEGVLVAGTNGIRKIRCGSTSRGKSGSIRVLFADYPNAGRTYLLAAFGKNEKDNISRSEARELGAIKRNLDKTIERRRQDAKRN